MRQKLIVDLRITLSSIFIYFNKKRKNVFLYFLFGEFFSKNNATIHERTHLKEKPLVYAKCSSSFSRRRDLTRHLNTIHYKKKHFYCNVCAKAFSRSDSLKVHTRTHTGLKPFTCSLCTRSFSQISGLKKHLSTHTTSKQFSCLQCSKTFSRRDVCTRHQQSHIEGEPLAFGNSYEFSSVVKAQVQLVDRQEDKQLQHTEPDVEFFDCKSDLQ